MVKQFFERTRVESGWRSWSALSTTLLRAVERDRVREDDGLRVATLL